MQPLPAAFLALLLAHLLADFPLQSSWMIRNKTRNFLALSLHGAMHYVLTWACLMFFARLPFLSIRTQGIVVGCLVLHLVIDRLKGLLIARSVIPDNWRTFLLDQALHLVTLVIAASFITRTGILAWMAGVTPLSSPARARILETAIIYAAVVFGGGYLVRYLTRDMAPDIAEETPAQLENAGLYIGWIERALVITAMAMQSPALVGLILTGKSIARLPEFKATRFAEYFLIGTLLSFSLAVLGGIALLHLLYGTVSLK
jgi:hypothetical protein